MSDNQTQTTFSTESYPETPTKIATAINEDGREYYITLHPDGSISRTAVLNGLKYEKVLDSIGDFVFDIHYSLTLGQASDIVTDLIRYAKQT